MAISYHLNHKRYKYMCYTCVKPDINAPQWPFKTKKHV